MKIKHMNETTTQKYTRVKVVGTVTMQFISALYFPTFGALCHVDHGVIKTYRKQTFHSDTKPKSQKCLKNPDQLNRNCVILVLLTHSLHPKKNKNSPPSWWFQPILKILSQNGNLPQVGVKIQKYLSCHHLDSPFLNGPEEISRTSNKKNHPSRDPPTRGGEVPRGTYLEDTKISTSIAEITKATCSSTARAPWLPWWGPTTSRGPTRNCPRECPVFSKATLYGVALNSIHNNRGEPP